MTAVLASSTPASARIPHWRRALPWVALVALLLVAQALLVMLTIDYESTRAQERVDGVAAEASAEFRHAIGRHLQQLQALQWQALQPASWRTEALRLLAADRALLRVERRTPGLAVLEAVDSPQGPPLFSMRPRASMDIETELACTAARRAGTPTFSRSYFVPQPGGLGLEVMDLCLPMQAGPRDDGFAIATFSLAALLEAAATPAQARSHELSFVEGDGTRLARAGVPRGAGIYHAERVVDLPGLTLQLRADSAESRPQLIPNLTTALVMGLSLALCAVVVLLLRDLRKRAQAENALAEALAFRKAMEDSLVTGLRARDLEGRVTYANPAFCAMVGFGPDELQAEPPPYWPPEHVAEYRQRHADRMAGGEATRATREGFETVFMRRGGERFPVMIYEAPLVDGQGRHAGWMSTVLDIGAQRRIEELSRQQQERLQATARLATVGEMASLLSHELNQPLTAIAGYANGSMNLLAEPDGHTVALLKQAVQRIAEQAERAGRVIKSVHDFVRRREQAREAVRCDVLIDAVLPLVRLQARKSGTRVELDLLQPVPRVLCDRTMIEQVLLNLTRNGIQAMASEETPPQERVLVLRVRPAQPRWIAFSVIDAGAGIAPEVAQRLFTPFFTTRSEGMGLGLSLCRTVVEQHGGALYFTSPIMPDGGGTEFRFTLPAPPDAVPPL